MAAEQTARSARMCSRSLIWAIASAFAGSVTAPTAFAQIRVETAVSTKRIYLGDSLVLQFTVQQPSNKPPVADQAALESIGAKVLSQRMVGQTQSIINGVSSEHFTFRLQFEITPTRSGVIRIPAISITNGADSATSAPVEIDVIGPEPQEFAWVELESSDRTVYPGQSVTLTAVVYLRRLAHQGELLEYNPFDSRDAPKLRIPWLEGTEVLKVSRSVGVPPEFLKGTLEQRAREDGPSFLLNDLFVRSDVTFTGVHRSQVGVRLDRTVAEHAGSDGSAIACYRYTLPLEFRAAVPGTVGPLTIQLRGPIYSAVKRGVTGFEPDSREVFAVSKPLTLTVASVPKANQPDTFTGGVGVFQIAATAAPTNVHVGDPVTLTVRVTGQGNLEEIGPPKLAVQEKWNKDFKVYEDTAPGRLDGAAKVFAISVRPKTAGLTELPSIRLSYFNPKLKKYEDTYSDRLALSVAESPKLDTTSLVDAANSGVRRDLEELSGGLAANDTGPDVLEPQQPYDTGPAWWLGVAGIPPICWCIAYAVHRRWVHRRHNPAWLRAQTAYRRAMQRLDSVTNDSSGNAPNDIARTVARYLTDRLDLPPGEVTPAEAIHHAQLLGVPATASNGLVELLERCDRARFARGTDGAAVELVETARRVLAQLEETGRNDVRKLGVSELAGRIMCFLVALICGPAVRADTPFDRHACLARATAAFERGARADDQAAALQSFREAIAEYQQLVSDGVENGRLYYNLANAYFRVGDIPRAILNYRLAERLLPRDERIAANLLFARSRVPDRIEASDTSRLLRQLLVIHHTWSIRERILGAVTAFWLAWLIWSVRIWVRKRSLTVVGSTFFVLALSLAVSAQVQRTDDVTHPIGVLAADGVTVRTGDGETYEAAFNRPLSSGIEFSTLNRRSDWLQLEFPDGKTGWIRSDQAVVAVAH